MAGRLDSIAASVGKYRCERCGLAFLVEELVEEEDTNAIVCGKCLDQQGINEQKRDTSTGMVEHHFTT